MWWKLVDHVEKVKEIEHRGFMERANIRNYKGVLVVNLIEMKMQNPGGKMCIIEPAPDKF